MAEINIDEMAHNVAEKALDGIEYQGKTIREWIEIIVEQTTWIPVSERLPKNDEDILVCSSRGAMEVCYYHIDDTFYPTEYADLNETGWYNEDDDALGFEPIAWMPLPPCYEPQERSDKE